MEAAVFLHGLAGDFACLAQDEHTVLATDTVGHLWRGVSGAGEGCGWVDVDCGDGGEWEWRR